MVSYSFRLGLTFVKRIPEIGHKMRTRYVQNSTHLWQENCALLADGFFPAIDT